MYAIVERLRARAPATTSARELAAHFEVSTRTIERDISALQQAGVPIWAGVGRRGGLGIDPAFTLPPLNLTAAEAVAVAVALGRDAGSPFASAGRAALAKVAAVMPGSELAGAQQVTERIRLLDPGPVPGPSTSVAAVEGVGRALVLGRALELDYGDAAGSPSRRVVEPMGLVANGAHWYLVAWCRQRDAARAFRLDRIAAAAVLDESARQRPFDLADDELRRLARRPDWS